MHPSGTTRGGLMTKAPSDDHKRLLEAAFAFAETGDLAALDPTRLAQRANVTRAIAESCFGDRQELLIAVHREFQERLLARYSRQVGTGDPGMARLQQGICALLDYSLRHVSLRRQLLALAPYVPELSKQADSGRADFRFALSAELSALGIANRVDVARMLRALIEELADIEMEEGHPQAGLRQDLWLFLGIQLRLQDR